MQYRKLGNSGLKVAPLVLGGNVFGWTVREQTAADQIFDTFVAGGFNLMDTADSYPAWVAGNQGGESEAMIGNWLARRGKRQDVLIATKVGWEITPERKGLAKAYILRSAEGSLKRLRTDYIDLYQAHKDDPTTPLEETLEAFAELLRQGKVRAIGASNYSPERLGQALRTSEERELPRFESLQPKYNLYDREEFERTLAPLCREKGLGVICYYSLAAGFLTGKYRSPADLAKSPRGARTVRNYLNPRGLRILAALDKVGERHRAKPAQVALAWLMSRPTITAPIASATSVEQLNELMAAARLELDADSLRLLDEASASQSSAATQAVS
jgi:aryl-alcohol dehydrogenase-like predicted oxidoreductase